MRHRGLRLRQQELGAFHAAAVVIAMRRQAERLPEGPAEIVRTQPGQPCESRKRDRLGEMVFDVGGDEALLPGGKPTLCRSFAALRPGIDPSKLMRQDGAEGFEVRAVVGTGR